MPRVTLFGLLAGVVPLIRAAAFHGSGAASTVNNLDSSAFGWVSGDFVLALAALAGTAPPTGGASVLSSIAGQDVTGADTYSGIDSILVAGAKLYARSGNITSPFDAQTRLTVTVGVYTVLGLLSIRNTSGLDSSPIGKGSGSLASGGPQPFLSAVTSAVANCLMIGVVAIRGNHDAALIQPPPNWSLVAVGKSTTAATAPDNSTFETLAVASLQKSAAGDYGSTTGWTGFGGTTAPWSAMSLAFKP